MGFAISSADHLPLKRRRICDGALAQVVAMWLQRFLPTLALDAFLTPTRSNYVTFSTGLRRAPENTLPSEGGALSS
jgi:hypothetical protein